MLYSLSHKGGEEMNIVDLFNRLSPDAQQKVIDYLKGLLSSLQPLVDDSRQDENTKQ